MTSPAELLQNVIHMLEQQFTPIVVSTWFGDASAVTVKDGVFILLTTSRMKREMIENRYAQPFCEAARELTGEDLALRVLSGDEELRLWREANEDTVYANYTFERFIVGSSNKFAHAAALAVAQNPAASYNPLFIYGPSGLGKTHLLYAIAGYIARTRPPYRIVYVKGDDFTNELISAIQRSNVEGFREKYRMADLLLVDDIQFIAGKITLHESGKQIVLTSDRKPKEILTLEDRLQSRFEWGLIADIQPPDFETRMALVNAKAEMRGVELPPDVVEYIASSITNNVRQLEGAINKILAKHTLMKQPIDIKLTEECVQDIFKTNPGLKPTAELILDETANFYNITPDRILGTAKTKDVVMPRQVAMYLIREMTNLSLPEIGRFMGRNHTTVLYSIEKTQEQIEKDDSFASTVNDLKKNIQNH